FLHPVPKDLKPQPPTTGVQLILNHLLEVWVNGNPQHFEYLINWFAFKAQFPHEKNGVAIVIKSLLQGAGKGSILEFFKKFVFGFKFCRSLHDMDAFLNKFNAPSEFILITCLEEIGEGGRARKDSGKMKDIITRKDKRIEPKGLEARDVPDYEDLIMFTNDNWIVTIE